MQQKKILNDACANAFAVAIVIHVNLCMHGYLNASAKVTKTAWPAAGNDYILLLLASYFVEI